MRYPKPMPYRSPPATHSCLPHDPKYWGVPHHSTRRTELHLTEDTERSQTCRPSTAAGLALLGLLLMSQTQESANAAAGRRPCYAQDEQSLSFPSSITGAVIKGAVMSTCIPAPAQVPAFAPPSSCAPQASLPPHLTHRPPPPPSQPPTPIPPHLS